MATCLGALSLVTDMAAGVPSESSIKTSAIAGSLALQLELTVAERSDAYYTALLRHLGCTSFAHEAARLNAGDDHQFLQTFEDVDPRRRGATGARAIRRLATGARVVDRAVAVTRLLARPGTADALAFAQCAQAAALASDIAMSPAVVRALGQIYEHFDGSGPRKLAGDEIELSARLLHVANVVEVQHRHGGRVRAEAELRRRAGRQLDPQLTAAALANREAVWALLERPSIWDEFLALEPRFFSSEASSGTSSASAIACASRSCLLRLSNRGKSIHRRSGRHHVQIWPVLDNADKQSQ